MNTTRRTLLGSSLALPFIARDAFAQGAYPNAPIRMIVPFAAGGTADIFARFVAEHLRTSLGRPVVVENVGGAGGMVGITQLARANPDGYTIGLASTSSLAINPILSKATITYKVEDLAPISQIATVPNVLAVNPGKIPAKTVPELIAYLKSKPDQVTYGSAGVGTSQHLAAELFQQMAGVSMVHVPYRGSSQMVPDLLSGTVELTFDNVPLILPYAKEGKLRFLATATPQRADFDKNLPAVSEFLPGFEATAWHGFLAPAKTPKPIIETLSKSIQEMMAMPATKERFAELGATAVVSTADDFATKIAVETKRWQDVIEARGIKLEG
ncbi:tripartite tricarboxylate transporter substrate binding protein [Acetobacteraceae bacterium H6797]|nr:tripartite tricarboxylate transporter substrate binding protein [Acetobacteraceae bacterium H6797]